MEYYFAPLEGITGYVYRNTHHKFFPGTDRYYTPFAAPNYTKNFKTKEKQDIAPENNAGVPLVPQILSNKADETLWAVEEMAQRGYGEVNLNLGCPMPTVARKKKGSGLLKYTDELDAYLDGVYEGIAKGQHEGGGRSGAYLQPLPDQPADRTSAEQRGYVQGSAGQRGVPSCIAKQ